MDEHWAQVEDSVYYVSDCGNVRGVRGAVHRKILQGRYMVRLWQRHTTLSVHRLVAKAFIANPANFPLVRFKDGNVLNCHWTNLEWVPRPAHDCICKQCGFKYPLKHFKITAIKGTVVYRRRTCSTCLNKYNYARGKKKLIEKMFNNNQNGQSNRS